MADVGVFRCTHDVQGWLGSRDTVLHSGDGPISCVRWAGSLIAWTTPAGAKASLRWNKPVHGS